MHPAASYYCVHYRRSIGPARAADGADGESTDGLLPHIIARPKGSNASSLLTPEEIAAMQAPRKLTDVGTIGRASLSTPRARAGAHAVRRVSLRPVLDVRAAPTLLHRHTQGGMEHIVRPRRRRAEIRPRYTRGARVPRLALLSPRSIVAGELLKFLIAFGVITLRADSTAAPAGSLSDRLKWLMEHSAKMAVRRAAPNTRSAT